MRTEFANWEGTKRTNGAGMQTLIERREGALGGYQRGVTGPEGWVSDLGYCLKSCKVFAKPGTRLIKIDVFGNGFLHNQRRNVRHLHYPILIEFCVGYNRIVHS